MHINCKTFVIKNPSNWLKLYCLLVVINTLLQKNIQNNSKQKFQISLYLYNLQSLNYQNHESVSNNESMRNKEISMFLWFNDVEIMHTKTYKLFADC